MNFKERKKNHLILIPVIFREFCNVLESVLIEKRANCCWVR